MRFNLGLLAAVACLTFTAACGSGPNPVDKQNIRRNADDADRDLDRESQRNQD